jgi:predicted DNA-binding transcriptional regulator AlpA
MIASNYDTTVKAVIFPAPMPIKLGPNSVAWIEEEIQNRLAERAAERSPRAS